MKTYEEFEEMSTKQAAIVDELSDKLNSFPMGQFGLVIESVRLSDEYKAINSQFRREFKKLQEINKLGSRLFKKQIWAAIEEKRSKKKPIIESNQN